MLVPNPAGQRTFERMLEQIWSELLGLEAVDIRESFFDLGGHSLLATRVASRVRSRLGVALPLQSVFQAPTVAELATVIDELVSTGPPRHDAPLVRVPRGSRRLKDRRD